MNIKTFKILICIMSNRASSLTASADEDHNSQSISKLNQRTKTISKGEGCPVTEESGAICGETDTLSVFQEFRKIYEECLAKLENSDEGSAILVKLKPFITLMEDLWQQNSMLVETVEELEHEATCQVSNLQDILNKSCQKMCDYENDIKSLCEIIRRLKECGVVDYTGLTFSTMSPYTLYENLERSESTKGNLTNKKNSISFRLDESCKKGNTFRSESKFQSRNEAYANLKYPYSDSGFTNIDNSLRLKDCLTNLNQISNLPPENNLNNNEFNSWNNCQELTTKNKIQLHSIAEACKCNCGNESCKCEELDSEDNKKSVNINLIISKSNYSASESCNCCYCSCRETSE